MLNETLLVNKADFTDLTYYKGELPDLADGHIRVDVGPWALTANNVTYMVSGDQIGYWGFFAPKAYGIEPTGVPSTDLGRMPVWGYATVSESRCEGVNVGDEIYGFFPIAKHFDMQPGKVSAAGFHDAAAHRQELHSLYNGYTFINSDPSFALHTDLQPVLRPLFTTSFLIDDFLDDEDFFDADQVLLLSASSKTALGTAYCLKQRGGITVVGLTSSGNQAFTESTKFYDIVHTYDAIEAMDKNVKTVVVDMSGNAAVIDMLEAHFDGNLTYICRVGMSHWQDAVARPPKRTQTPTKFFFAPDRAKKRIGDWTREGFTKNLGERWIPFCDSASAWLELSKAQGIEPVLENYKLLLEGQSLPDKGYLFTL